MAVQSLIYHEFLRKHKFYSLFLYIGIGVQYFSLRLVHPSTKTFLWWALLYSMFYLQSYTVYFFISMLGLQWFVTNITLKQRISSINIDGLDLRNESDLHIRYEQDIPIITFCSPDSYTNGFNHGLYLSRPISKLFTQIFLVLHSLTGHQTVQQLTVDLDLILSKLPINQQRELQGIADGFNRAFELERTYDQESSWIPFLQPIKLLSVHDILYLHLLADSDHLTRLFQPGSGTGPFSWLIRKLACLFIPGCTSFLYRTKNNQVVFGRNMDWPPFGDGADYSAIMIWEKEGIASLTVPGLVGIVTGWNSKGSILSMNVSPGNTLDIHGVPAVLYNRLMLASNDDVASLSNIAPLGPYHITFYNGLTKQGFCRSKQTVPSKNQKVDKTLSKGNAESKCRLDSTETMYSLLDLDYIRHLGDNLHDTLETFNFKYPDLSQERFFSTIRNSLVTSYIRFSSDFWNLMDKEILMVLDKMSHILSLPFVNSWITAHSFIFDTERNHVYVRFNNGYAASYNITEYTSISMNVFSEIIKT